MREDIRLVYVTTGSEDEAATIARKGVDERLAACANIIGGIRSIYRWKGKIEDDKEILLIAKTPAGGQNRLVRRIHELHSYEVPDIISLPIVTGHEPYLEWVGANVA